MANVKDGAERATFNQVGNAKRGRWLGAAAFGQISQISFMPADLKQPADSPHRFPRWSEASNRNTVAKLQGGCPVPATSHGLCSALRGLSALRFELDAAMETDTAE